MSLPSSVTANYLDFFGAAGINLEDAGTLHTDRGYLATATAVIRVRRDQWNSSDMNTLANIGSVHPIFTSIRMEDRELSIQGPWAFAKCKYAGIDSQYEINGTPPQYELIIGVSESPIATHPKFVSRIGGTAVAPLNRANFRNVITNKIATTEAVAGDSKGFVFDSFDILKTDGTTINPLAGVTSYLEANMSWRKSWKMYRLPVGSEIDDVGTRVSTPPGNPPAVSSGREWMDMGINVSHQRGSAYFWTQEWRLSGRRGWIHEIYDA